MQQGTLPILLTAPHGGTVHIDGVPDRKTGERKQDSDTYEIAVEVADRLEKRLGARPYLVAARFHRASVDANRAPAEAYEDDGAKAAYDAYHAAIAGYVKEIGAKWPGVGLLLDIHGQAEFDGIHRGTKDGKTAARLVQRLGVDALVGKDGLFGRLAASGYAVFPPVGKPLGAPGEDPRFNGGYTVGTYGSEHEEGIDAIQVEIGPRLRKDAVARRKLIDDLSAAIADFHKAAQR